MDNPEVCPHGSPIPRKDLKRPAGTGITLASLDVGQSAVVANVVIERDPEFLRYLTGLEVTPGAVVKVIEKASYDGTLTIEVNNASRAIGREAASLILVKPVKC